MSPTEQRELVSAYIEHSKSRIVLGADLVFAERSTDETFWAFETLGDIARNDPSLCLALIIEILASTDDENVLAVLAAGPLEDVLVHHGPILISQVEREAETNEKFKYLLGGVWRNSIAPEVWGRVEASRGKPW